MEDLFITTKHGSNEVILSQGITKTSFYACNGILSGIEWNVLSGDENAWIHPKFLLINENS